MSSVTAQRIASGEMYADEPAGLECESQLRVAAATLAHASEITATTVVGELRPAQRAQFDRLIDDIVDDFGLDAVSRVEDGRFSVRFVHLPELVEPVQTSPRASRLSRLVASMLASLR